MKIISGQKEPWTDVTWESTVTLEPRTSTQCWTYHRNPAQCSDDEHHTYCTPTLGRLEKILLQSFTNVTNWGDRLQYEPFCKAYFQELEPQHDIFRYYKKLVQTGQFSELFNTKWFSLHSMHSANGNPIYVPRQFNFSYWEIKPSKYYCSLTNSITSLWNWYRIMSIIK